MAAIKGVILYDSYGRPLGTAGLPIVVDVTSSPGDPVIVRVVDSAAAEILGLTNSPAVTTDADGSVAAWLRGLVALTDAQRMIAPASADAAQNDVTSAAAVSFTVVAGRKYWISVLQDMNFLDGSAPTSTTGQIIPAGAMVGPIEAASTSFQFIARGTTGRVSVSQVNP